MIFSWDKSCETAFSTLKQKLINAPVLTYPTFTRPFVLETDTYLEGLGAVLSQLQDDGQLHPIAYASKALASSERKYGITELEILAQESMFVIVDGVLYNMDPKKHSKQVVVPQHLCKQLIDEYHRRKTAGHFSVDRVFKTMASK